jgi:thioredoxin reductase (NADPH)
MPRTRISPAKLDCLVIGGGPAGLTAALYLARFSRRFAIVDTGDSRASRIPNTRTLPMYPGGVSGPRLLKDMAAHVASYGVRVIKGDVAMLGRSGHGFSARLASGRMLKARRVILCTGAQDVELAVPGLESAVRDGQIRYCPICDGPEVALRKIGVIGYNAHAPQEALFIAETYSRNVTLLTLGQRMRVSPALQRRLLRRRIAIVRKRLHAIEFPRGGRAVVRFADGQLERFDTLYSALGLEARSQLALRLGATATQAGMLKVSEHQETTVPGLYAAGGVVRGLDQLLIAMGHAAVAATDVHNRTERPALRPRSES